VALQRPASRLRATPRAMASGRSPPRGLIERSGFARGYGNARVRVSSKHTLALVNANEGTTRDLLALAREIVRCVEATFGVTLVPEPVMLGCSL